MKKRLTRGEKLLFASPLLFLLIAGAAWQWKKSGPLTFEVPNDMVVDSLEFSPESGRLVAFLNGSRATDQIKRVYDLKSRSKLCDLADPPSLLTIKRANAFASYYYKPSWSPDGKNIVSDSLNPDDITDRIAIWDARSGDNVADWVYPKEISTVNEGLIRYSADGKTLIGEGVPPARFDVATGKRLNNPASNIHEHRLTKPNVALRLNAVGSRSDGYFQVVNSKTHQVLWQPKIGQLEDFEWHDNILWLRHDVNWSSDWERRGRQLLLWDGKARKPLPILPEPSGADVDGPSFYASQNTLAYMVKTPIYDTSPNRSIVGKKSELVVWNYRTKRVLWRAKTSGELYHLQPSPDGQWLAVVTQAYGEPAQLMVFDRRGQLHFERKVVDQLFSWSPDSKQMAMVVFKVDTSGNTISSRIEIQRFKE